MLILRRVDKENYKLENEEGDAIAQYHQRKMAHPQDWREDAEDAGYSISGRDGWKYVDDRDLS